MALNLAGLSPGRLAVLLIIGLIAVSTAIRALRSYLSRHLVLDHDAAAASGVKLDDGRAHAGLDKIHWIDTSNRCLHCSCSRATLTPPPR
jgi:hypothetical protein